MTSTSATVQRATTVACLLIFGVILTGCETVDALQRDLGLSPSEQTNAGPTLTSPTSVARAQEMLKTLGYAPGSTDGIPGPKTTAAVTSFQKSKRMNADGRITEELIAALRKESIQQNPTATSKAVAAAQKNDVKKGTIGGGLLGTAAVVAAKDKLGLSTSQAIAAGAIVGGVAGNVVGNKTADARGEYAQENAALDAAFSARTKAIDGINRRAQQTETKVKQQQQEVDKLQQRIIAGESNIEELDAAIAQMEADIKTNKRLTRDLKIQIDLTDLDIKAIEAEMAKFPDNDKLVSNRNSLTAKRDELVVSMNSINGITPELQKQQDALVAQRNG